MELRDALGQISEIREQMARSSVFRGFRALPVACTGLFAVAGAVLQPTLVPEPARDPAAWLKLWIAVATLSVADSDFWSGVDQVLEAYDAEGNAS